MSITHNDITELERESADLEAEQGAALTQQLLESVGPALELLTIELGRRHGLYAAIDLLGAVTAEDLARKTGFGLRQLREWLDQQAISGILLADSSQPRRYRLPAVYRAVLLDPTSLLHGVGLAQMFAGIAETFSDVSEAFPRDGAVGFADFGSAVRNGLEVIYRPGYTHALALWMDSLPDIAARLDTGGTILDAGCGTGWSTIALAERFPRARVVGVDLDAASIAEARRNAVHSGIGERVSFHQADAGDSDALARILGEKAALVTVFLALHDMNDPQRALGAFAGVLAPAGAVLIGDAKVEDEFAGEAGPLDRMFAAFSVLHCLPATLAEGSGHAHGTVLRASSVEAWGAAAGLPLVSRLSIEHPTWSFYRLNA